ncbi:3822_t:CDS:2, partial [Cetraspora pellucida]
NFNDSYAEYLDYIIHLEKRKFNSSKDYNNEILEGLEETKRKYDEKVKLIKKKIENGDHLSNSPSIEDIFRLEQQLYSLSDVEQYLRNVKKEEERTLKYREKHYVYKISKNQNIKLSRSLPFLEAHSKAMSEITIFCLALGDIISKSFPVDINKGMTIGHLKDLIRQKKDPYYNNISADEFELWGVDIPINMENVNTRINEENICEYKGVKLLPNTAVETFVSENNKYNIRIIVQPPATTGVGIKYKGISRLGGLGGTNMKRREDGLGYEGLDLSNFDSICQRKETINRLLSDLLKKRIILVRSPPMAGKTSLAQLLEYHILKSDEVNNGLRCVFRISLMWMIKRGMEWTFAEGFKLLMNMEWGEFIQSCRHSEVDIILIVDEVQLIYKPQNENEPRNGGSIFWNTFKDVNQYLSNLYIVAFASYGHYGAYTSYGDHSVMDISPPSILCKENTWGFSDVRFTTEEFNDYFLRFCETRLHMLKKGDIPFLHNYVSEITAFHPGLTAFTMDEIYKRFFKRTSELEF